jgi:hypothetical protein
VAPKKAQKKKGTAIPLFWKGSANALGGLVHLFDGACNV